LKKTKSGGQSSFSKEMFTREVLIGLIGRLKETRAIIFSTVSNPHMDVGSMKTLFQKKIHLRKPFPGERRCIILDSLATGGMVSSDLGNDGAKIVQSLTQRTDGCTLPQIQEFVMNGLKRIDLHKVRSGQKLICISDFSLIVSIKDQNDDSVWENWLDDPIPDSTVSKPEKGNGKPMKKDSKK
jgi:hypothetical protein